MNTDEKLFRAIASELVTKGVMYVKIITPACYAVSGWRYNADVSDEIKNEFVWKFGNDVGSQLNGMKVGDSIEYEYSEEKGSNSNLKRVLSSIPGGPYVFRKDIWVLLTIREKKKGMCPDVILGLSDWLYDMMAP